MRAQRGRLFQEETSLPRVPLLAFIYVVLLVITRLFSHTFFEGLISGFPSSPWQLVVFLSVPAILFAAFIYYLVVFLHRTPAAAGGKRSGGRRIIAYFCLTSALASLPALFITLKVFQDASNYMRSINAISGFEDAEDFIIETYELKLADFEQIQTSVDFDRVMARFSGLSDPAAALESPDFPGGGDILAIQDFEAAASGTPVSRRFVGSPSLKLESVSAEASGFLSRELPRDRDIVRFVENRKASKPEILRVVTYTLGAGFDEKRLNIEAKKNHYANFDSSLTAMRTLLLVCYAVFLLPCILVTLGIAYTLTNAETARFTNEMNAVTAELERLKDEKTREDKVSVWQAMAQQLAHEIKNPLTPIKLSAERVLRLKRTSPERLEEALEPSMLAIVQEVESLSTLLGEFSSLARPISPSKTEINIREEVEKTITPYRASYPKVIFNTISVSTLTVRMDRRHFEQVLSNLVLNAIDAMDGAGILTIRAETIVKQAVQYCRLIVQDSGKGISAEDAGRIFTPYFTTKESGTGLGLSIVERIVNDYGGSILCNSAPGQGASFVVDLRS